jgi:hypothetical protein
VVVMRRAVVIGILQFMLREERQAEAIGVQVQWTMKEVAVEGEGDKMPKVQSRQEETSIE